MGKRTWIDSDIWADTDDLDNDGKLFYIYLLTNEQRNIAGYYKVNLRYMALDLGLTAEKVEEKLMMENKYWIYDKPTKQVLIPKFTRFNIVKSRQQFSKLNIELASLKPCRLHKMFLNSFIAVNGVGAELMIEDKFKRLCDGPI